MNDDALLRRLLDAVVGPSDPRRDRALEEELADRPELAREYRRLREAWNALGGLPAGPPPREARERAREAVLRAAGTREGSPASEETRHRWNRWPVRVAAGLVLFLSGAATGTAWAERERPAVPAAEAPAEVADGARFVLLIRGGDVPGREESTREAMAEWARGLSADDRLVWAEHLRSDRSALVGADSGVSGDVPPVGGLFVIRARSREEAVRLAEGSPNVALGGVVEVVPTAGGTR